MADYLTQGAPNEAQEAEANARLAASAPELLEALRFYACHCRSCSPECAGGDIADCGWKARAAIAKATGETP